MSFSQGEIEQYYYFFLSCKIVSTQTGSWWLDWKGCSFSLENAYPAITTQVKTFTEGQMYFGIQAVHQPAVS